MTAPKTDTTRDAAPEDPFRGLAASLLIECLHRRGVSTIFGVPGDTGVALYDALYHRRDEVRHVLARDERHAVSMADAYARARNHVGVVEVSSGGGTTYAVGGLGEAFAASVPVLLITSDIHTGSRGTGALTEIDQEQLFAAVTKWRTTVDDAADIPAAVDEALRQATTGRPAPVVVILPEDVLDEKVEVLLPASAAGAPATALPRVRPAAPSGQVAAVATLLAGARRPAILAGSGVHVSQAWEALAALAEAGGLPIATSIQGKGAVPDGHPWSLGVAGANGARPYANAYLRDADAVLFVGTRANATDTNSWTGPRRQGVPTASIDICTTRAGRNFPDGIRLVGDARVVLTHLRDALPPVDSGQVAERRAWIARERESWFVPGPSQEERAQQTPRLSPRRLVQVAREVLDADCTVVADPGTPTPNVASYWDCETAGRNLLVPRGHGPMGYGIPAAVGAALARPDHTVLALTADGSFAMACGELETVARLGLPIVYLQMSNDGFGWIEMLQHLYEGGRYFGVHPGPIDAVEVARACGLEAEHVTSLEAFARALRATRDDRRPRYLDADVHKLTDETPPVAPWQAAFNGDAARPVY